MHGNPVPASAEASPAVTPLDFTRQSHLSRDDIRGLEVAHERFSRRVTSVWSSALRALVQLDPIGVDELSYDDYVRSMPSPNVLGLVSLPPLPGTVIVELNAQLALALVDRLLGGAASGARTLADPRRPTDLEAALLRDLFQVVAGGVASTMSTVTEVTGELTGLEFNPQLVHVASPADRVVLLAYRLHATGDLRAEGLLTVCYPASLATPLLEGIRQPADGGIVASTGQVDPVLAGLLGEVEVDLAASFTASRVAAADIAALAEGDVLRLDHRVDHPLCLLLDDRLLLFGHAGRRGRRLAVQVAGWADPSHHTTDDA